jgi:long-subunit fatty acid transport protein
MTRTAFASLAATVGLAGALHAGAVDRSGQSTEILFEEGNLARFSFGHVSPDISGVQVIPVGPLPPGGSSGDAGEAYQQFGAAYKHDFGNGFEAAIVYDQPFGAVIDYPAGEPYFAQGADADLDTDAFTGFLKYTFESNVSVFGGLRYQSFSAEAFIPYVSPIPGVTPPYAAQGDEEWGFGYAVGIGYEIPEIALRVSLTYNSAIDYDIETTETSVLGTTVADTDVSTPQSVNLEFQTGIAADTLLFGGVRWADWTEFEIAPQDYLFLTGLGNPEEGQPLVGYDEDIWTLSLGVGRAFTETLSGAVSVTWEPQVGGFASNLGPTDGIFSVGLGGTYRHEGWELTGGVRYAWIGDAETRAGGDVQATEFEDNTAIGFGVEVAYRF